MKKLSAVMFVLATGACNFGGAKTGNITATLHGVTYEFPKNHVNAAVIPPEGRLFVRLAPPDSDFHLVLDEWGDQPSDQGPDFPRISRLNDRFGKFSLTPSSDGPIVCDLGPQPHFNCGFRLDDGPVRWGVLFDRDQLGQIKQIREHALNAVRSYKPFDPR